MSRSAIADRPAAATLDLVRGTSSARGRDSQELAERPLALRVSGPGCPGRVVQIRSAKCTIGSAAGCTLRLHSRHVPRLACWIVRGKHKIAVRRFEGCATLNGASFELAELRPGDRLLVGNVEVELLAPGAERHPAPGAWASAGQLRATGQPADDAENWDSICQIEARLEAALQKVAQLEQESRQGFQASIVAAERAEQMHEALAAAHRELEETAAELTQTQAKLERARAELVQSQAELAQTRSELDRMRTEVQRLDSGVQRHGSEVQRPGLGGHATQPPALGEACAADWPVATQQPAQRQAELDARQADLDARQAKLDAGQADLDAQEAKLNALQGRLDARQAELETRLAELETQSAAQAERGACLDRKEAELVARAEQLKAQSASVTQRAGELERQQAELASRAAELNDRAAALDARESGLQQRAEELDRQARQIAHRAQELDAQAAELEAQREEVQRRLAELERMQEPMVSRPAAACWGEDASWSRPSSGAATLVMTDESLVPQRQRPICGAEAEVCTGAAAPASVDDQDAGKASTSRASEEGDLETVLGRLVRAGLWREEAPASSHSPRERCSAGPVEGAASGGMSHEPETPAGALLPDTDCGAGEERSSPVAHGPAPGSPPAAAPEEDRQEEEESIEAYMARLLERVRGESGTAGASRMVDAAPAPTPAPAAPPAPAPVTAEPASKLTPEAYVPRSNAPESPTHLSALREVANVAARVAVGRHTRRQAARAAAGTFLRGLLSSAGGAAAAYWAWQVQSLPGLAGAAIGGLMGVAWTVAALKQLAGALVGTEESAHAARAPRASAS